MRLTLLVMITLCLSGFAQDSKPVAPPATFLKDYDSFVAGSTKLQNQLVKLQAKQQKEADRLNGVSARLSRQIPQGYTYDASLRMFMPLPKPTPPPTPPPPKVEDSKPTDK